MGTERIFANIIGSVVGENITIWDEILDIKAGFLYIDSPPARSTGLTEWVRAHAHLVGRRYANELSRNRDRRPLILLCP